MKEKEVVIFLIYVAFSALLLIIGFNHLGVATGMAMTTMVSIGFTLGYFFRGE